MGLVGGLVVWAAATSATDQQPQDQFPDCSRLTASPVDQGGGGTGLSDAQSEC